MIYPIQNPKFLNGACLNISQYWGENVDYYKKHFNIDGGHLGLDFAYIDELGLPAGKFSYGKPILAAHDGLIKSIIWDSEHSTKGNGVYIENASYMTVYWHLSRIADGLLVNQWVKEGDIIGYMGNNGTVFPVPNLTNETTDDDFYGTHLHFALKVGDNYVDPLPYLTQTPMRYVIDQNKNQWLVDDVFRIAFSIPDEKALLSIKQKGGIQPDQEPKFINSLVNYLIWRGAPDEQFKQFFNL